MAIGYPSLPDAVRVAQTTSQAQYEPLHGNNGSIPTVWGMGVKRHVQAPSTSMSSFMESPKD